MVSQASSVAPRWAQPSLLLSGPVSRGQGDSPTASVSAWTDGLACPWVPLHWVSGAFGAPASVAWSWLWLVPWCPSSSQALRLAQLSQETGSSRGLQIPLPKLSAFSTAAHHKYSPSPILQQARPGPLPGPADAARGRVLRRARALVCTEGSGHTESRADLLTGPRGRSSPAPMCIVSLGKPRPVLPASPLHSAGCSPLGLCGLSWGLCLPRPSPPSQAWGPTAGSILEWDCTAGQTRRPQ